MSDLERHILDILQPKLKEDDLFLVELRILPGMRINVFLDGKENIKIEKCAQISRYLENELEIKALVPEKYFLEVSSPGMLNPLRVPQQFEKRIGKVLEITLENGERFHGLIHKVSNEGITAEMVPEVINNKGRKTVVKSDKELKVLELGYGDIKKAIIPLNF